MARTICLQPCVPPTGGGQSVQIPFMGGSVVAAPAFSLEGGCDGAEFSSALMQQLSPFMAAMGMPLCLLGCISAVIKAVKAVPDSLGPPPDPTALIQAIANMFAKCQCVLAMALPPPAGSICQFLKMVRDIVSLTSQVITHAVNIMSLLVTMNLKAATMQASTIPGTQAAGVCLAGQVQTLSDAFQVKFGPVNNLFSVIQPVFDLLSAVVPPPFSATIAGIFAGFSTFNSSTGPGTSPGAVLAAMNTLAVVMQTAATAFVTIVSVCP